MKNRKCLFNKHVSPPHGRLLQAKMRDKPMCKKSALEFGEEVTISLMLNQRPVSYANITDYFKSINSTMWHTN